MLENVGSHWCREAVTFGRTKGLPAANLMDCTAMARLWTRLNLQVRHLEWCQQRMPSSIASRSCDCRVWHL